MHRHRCFGFFQELRSPAYLWWWLQAWVSLSNETSKSSEIPLDVSLQHRLGQSQALSLHQVHFQDPPVQASLIWHAHWFWLSPANSFTGLITPSHILNFSCYPMSPFSSFFLLFPLSPTALTSADWANKRNCRASAIAWTACRRSRSSASQKPSVEWRNGKPNVKRLRKLASRWLLSRRRRRIDGLPCPSPSGSMSF